MSQESTEPECLGAKPQGFDSSHLLPSNLEFYTSENGQLPLSKSPRLPKRPISSLIFSRLSCTLFLVFLSALSWSSWLYQWPSRLFQSPSQQVLQQLSIGFLENSTENSSSQSIQNSNRSEPDVHLNGQAPRRDIQSNSKIQIEDSIRGNANGHSLATRKVSDRPAAQKSPIQSNNLPLENKRQAIFGQPVLYEQAEATLAQNKANATAGQETKQSETENSIVLAELKRMQSRMAQVIRDIRPAVVAVDNPDSTGSGVIVSPLGIILTAAHVAGYPGRRITIIFADGSRRKAEVLSTNARSDSAILQISNPSGRHFPYAPMFIPQLDQEISTKLGIPIATRTNEKGNSSAVGDSSKKAETGDWCLAIGHSGGYRSSRPAVVRCGRLISQRRNTLRTDCALVGGDSGGPLVDLNGRVIGIHSRIREDLSQNYHVSTNSFARQLERYSRSKLSAGELSSQSNPETPSQGFLGIVGEDAFENSSIQKGLYVKSVMEGYPAAKAGIKIGDRILRINRDAVEDFESLLAALKDKEVGASVIVKILRNNRVMRFPLKLAKRRQ